MIFYVYGALAAVYLAVMYRVEKRRHDENCTCPEYCSWCHSGYYGGF